MQGETVLSTITRLYTFHITVQISIVQINELVHNDSLTQINVYKHARLYQVDEQ